VNSCAPAVPFSYHAFLFTWSTAIAQTGRAGGVGQFAAQPDEGLKDYKRRWRWVGRVRCRSCSTRRAARLNLCGNIKPLIELAGSELKNYAGAAAALEHFHCSIARCPDCRRGPPRVQFLARAALQFRLPRGATAADGIHGACRPDVCLPRAVARGGRQWTPASKSPLPPWPRWGLPDGFTKTSPSVRPHQGLMTFEHHPAVRRSGGQVAQGRRGGCLHFWTGAVEEPPHRQACGVSTPGRLFWQKTVREERNQKGAGIPHQ